MSGEQETLAIDPGGSSGALALSINGELIEVCNMPKTPADLLQLLWRYSNNAEARGNAFSAVVEKVGTSRPGNSAKSSHSFSYHIGVLHTALLANRIPFTEVLPRKWMRDLFGDCYPTGPSYAQTKARKHYIRTQLQKVYPSAKFTLAQADAVGILRWALVKQ